MESIFSTVSTIFEERYGASIKVEKASDRLGREAQSRGHWQSPFVYSRTLRQVSFPIFNAKKELNAIVTASPVENKDAIVFDEMAQFLQLTFAAHLELTDKSDTQDQIQLALERAHSDKSKVVELKTRKKDATPHFTYKKPEVKKDADLQPIWISGDDKKLCANIAFAIHDWVGNWAFINAAEIPELVWEDLGAWQNFPQVTLYIPDAETLSAEQQTLLLKNIEGLRKLEGEKPLIIISATAALSEELQSLRDQFKHYKANEKISARVQAHFLLYHHKQESPFLHKCEETKGVFFLPFSPGSKNWH